MLEIERTFLVKKLPRNLKKFRFVQIKQGYISDEPNQLRLRQLNDKFEITKKAKIGEGFSTHEETTINLTEAEFKILWKGVSKSLEKIRYFFPLDSSVMAEIDVFAGKLSGLILVDVEFKSKEEKQKFTAPNWFGRDVTEEEFSLGSFLAGKGFEEIKKYL